MAATVLSLTLPTYNAASYIDLTAATGGNSSVVGYTGADFHWTRASFPGGIQKEQGGEQITPSVWKTGADPDPTAGGLTDPARSPTIDALDILGTENGQSANNGSMRISTASSQINCGIQWEPIVSDQKLRTFLWLGRIANGTYVVTATFANGESPSPESITLPLGTVADTNVNAWWQCEFRSIAPTTVTFKLERTAIGPGAIGRIHNQVALLLVPTPPQKPRGRRIGRRH